MLPLRYAWLWAGLGWMLVIGVIVGSLMPGSSIPSLLSSDKLLHTGTYCLLMVWFSGMYRRGLYPVIALLLLLFGIALDLLQATTRTRSFELYDIAADAAGIAIGYVLALWLFDGWCQKVERRWADLWV